MTVDEVELAQVPLIDLARMVHVYENDDDDISMMRIMDEVHRRGGEAEREFQPLYMKVWPEFQRKR